MNSLFTRTESNDGESYLAPHSRCVAEKRTGKTMKITPLPGADEECDEADAEVAEAEGKLATELESAKRLLK